MEDAEYAVVQLAQTTMRSELGKIKLDSVSLERLNLNQSIVGKQMLLRVCMYIIINYIYTHTRDYLVSG